MSDQYIGIPEIINMMKEGKYQQAIPLLKDQLARDPKNVQAIACLAASYSQTGMKSEAIQEFIRLATLQPNNAVHYFNLGVAYEAADDAAKAKECFEKVLALNPGNQKAKEHLDAINANIVQTPAAVLPVTDSDLGSWPLGTTLDGSPAPTSPPTPSEIPSHLSYSSMYEAPIPQEVFLMNRPVAPEGLNWGGFLMPLFWSIGHGAWLWAIVALFFWPVASIVLLIKGNEIAFDNRQYNSVEEYKAIQKTWVICGIIFVIGWSCFTMYIVNSLFHAVKSGIQMSQQAMPGTPGGELAAMQAEMEQMKKDQQDAGGGDVTTSSGTDTNGSYTAMTSVMSLDPASAYTIWKEIVAKSGGTEIKSTPTSADFSLSSNGQLSTIHLEATNDNKTSVTTKVYRK